MPGKIDNQVYLPTGDPTTSVETAQFRDELGKVYNAPNHRRYQKVQYEATLTQAAVASNIVYWKDASSYIVTTDLTDSQGSRNTVAGVLPTSSGTLPTANQYAWVLQEGDSVTLNGTTVNFQAGGKIVASSTVGVVTVTAQATAAVDEVIGTVHTAVDRSGGAGTVVCDINIPSRL